MMDKNVICIKVCVKCWTYNHAPYIIDALEGFVNQRTDFPYVCIIVDDASTDGEPDVIRDYISKHFDLVDYTVVRNEETNDYVLSFARHKTNRNCFFAVYYLKYNHHGKKSKSIYFENWAKSIKYHAICEGDDYWIDQYKLSRQVALMEEHPEYSMCTENGYWLDLRTKEMTLFSSNPEKDVSIDEILIRRQFPTASVMYRSEFSSEFAKLHKPALDTSIWACLATKGVIHYLPVLSSVYRRGDGITEKDKIRWAYTVRAFNKSLYKDFLIPDYIKAIRDKDVAHNLKKGMKDAKQRRRYYDLLRLSLYYFTIKAGIRIHNFTVLCHGNNSFL